MDNVIGRCPARQRLTNPPRNLEQPVTVGWDACDVVAERLVDERHLAWTRRADVRPAVPGADGHRKSRVRPDREVLRAVRRRRPHAPRQYDTAMQCRSATILRKCFATIWSPRRGLPNPLPCQAIRSSLRCFGRHTNKDCNSPGEDSLSGNSNHRSNRASSSPRCRSTAGFGSNRTSHPLSN